MKRASNLQESRDFEKLHQKYEDLQQHWDSIKQSNPRTKSLLSVKVLRLLDNLPRELMSSIQNIKSPDSEVIWKVRTNELAVEEETIRQRRLAFKSGKLKGRRLFVDDDDEDGESEVDNDYEGGEDICSHCWIHLNNQNDRVDDDENEFGKAGSQESLSIPRSSICSTSDQVSDQVVEETEEEEENVDVVTTIGKDVCGSRKRRGWMFTMIWLAIALIITVCAFGISNSMQSLGERILVPT